MSFYKKVKAGSLQFVLFVGALIAVLLLAFVLLSYGHLRFQKKTDTLIKVIEKNDRALKLALQQNSEPALQMAPHISDDDRINTLIQIENWGLFKTYAVTSSFGKTQFQHVALVGHSSTSPAPALYVKDNERPIVVAGEVTIKGNAYLPKRGIKPGNIMGNTYIGNTLVQGRMYDSDKTFPKFLELNESYINALCNGIAPKNNNAVIKPVRNEHLINSFKNGTQYVVGSSINLSSVHLSGNIIVSATKEIVVDASSKLKDVILSAPKITIKANVRGTFQAFALKTITVGKNCVLQYPSALVVNETNPTSAQKKRSMEAAITIASSSTLKGMVRYTNASDDSPFYPKVDIQKNATLIGQLYCEKSVQLKGRVIGSVYTDSFLALENGNAYQNHLYNTSITIAELPSQFVGMGLDQTEQVKKIATWLY